MPVEDAFPEPLVYEPTSGVHKHTVILLHGRGGSADAFGPALLNTPLPITTRGTGVSTAAQARPHESTTTGSPAGGGVSGRHPGCCPTTLAQALPNARFVFPTAPRQRATVYRRSIVRQWFDDWHLGFAADEVDGRYDLGLQTTAMGRAVAYLHGLVAREAEAVGGGSRNVVLGGISQGCAVSLVASLLWGGDGGLGGVVGMCGWLPYVDQMRGQLCVGDEGDEADPAAGRCSDGEEAAFDPFDRSASPGSDAESPEGHDDAGGSVTAALEWLRDEIELPGRRHVTGGVRKRSTPAILCHGRADGKVDIDKGKEAADFLPALGVGPVRFEAYAGVEHEFSADMLLDVANFIQGVLGRPPS